MGNVIETIDPLGNATIYNYDALNRQVSATDPLGRTTTTVYDADDNVIETIDPLGFATTYTYDALNRQTGVEQPDGGITTTVYDADGQRDRDHRPAGSHDAPLVRRPQSPGHDDGRRIGGVTTYLYDAVGNETGVIDPDHNRTTFVYDALNRRVETIDPLNNTTTYSYDALDRLVSRTDALGRVTTYAYDADSRLVGETWHAAGGAVTDVFAYTYDADGNQLTAQDVSGTYTMTYDALDRVISTEDPFGLTLTYTYDADGNRILTQDSLGGVTTYVYDADNELTSEQFGGTGQVPLRIDMTYDGRGEFSTETRYSDLAATTVVAESYYTYNGDGEITNLLDRNGGGTIVANFTYTYDLADRVLTEVEPGDDHHLRLRRRQPVDQRGLAAGHDRLRIRRQRQSHQREQRRRPRQPAHDRRQLELHVRCRRQPGPEGRRATGPDHGITWTYTYNNENQMTTAVEVESGSTIASVTYVYDALGNRIEEDYSNGSDHPGDAVRL